MYNPDIHHRQSIRLDGYDYRQNGAYFLTVCTQERAQLLGRIHDGEMQESSAGRMVRAAWEELPERYPGVRTDAFVVTPNHFHGIVLLEEAPGEVTPFSLPDVAQRLKSFTTTLYRNGVLHQEWPSFPGRLRQRNYHEHVIRGEREWQTVREYIALNPLRWQEDEEYIP